MEVIYEQEGEFSLTDLKEFDPENKLNLDGREFNRPSNAKKIRKFSSDSRQSFKNRDSLANNRKSIFERVSLRDRLSSARK